MELVELPIGNIRKHIVHKFLSIYLFSLVVYLLILMFIVHFHLPNVQKKKQQPNRIYRLVNCFIHIRIDGRCFHFVQLFCVGSFNWFTFLIYSLGCFSFIVSFSLDSFVLVLLLFWFLLQPTETDLTWSNRSNALILSTKVSPNK